MGKSETTKLWERRKKKLDAFKKDGLIRQVVDFIEKAHYFDDYHNRERGALLVELKSLLEKEAG